ncbi:MAG: DUF4144 domain-containing protein [Gammaproteobacteria bacterium]|nr:DUF4144 domain-containing protein [Gammaproteobacteria bacterium]
MINWPAIIKFSDDPELGYVVNQSAWDSDAELRTFRYDESDWLIDSSGHVYSLMTTSSSGVLPQRTEKVMSLEEVLGLIKAHAAQGGSCCVAKLYAPTIDDAFVMLASLAEV